MDMANRSLPGAGGVLFLPHLSGERSPYFDPNARGAWVNLSLAHTQAELIRVVLEGVAFNLRMALEVIKEITFIEQLLATGGGAQSKIWLRILADVLQIELIAPKAEEGAAYGAAILAMVGVGVYPNFEAVFKILPQDSGTVQTRANPMYEAAFKRYKVLYEALKAVR